MSERERKEPMSQLELKGLSKTFDGKQWVLEGVDLQVAPGEFIVLVGPSGCGKSTLLRLVAGLEEPTAGEIRIRGRSMDGVPPAEREVGMVFQDYALYPHMRVRENLTFGLKVRKVAPAEIASRLKWAAEMLGLEPLLDRRPAELSGGQRQRVAIGRTLLRRPALFLFDEPLSNLDAQLRAQTRIEIASLHRRLGSTSVFVTHDQAEAMTLADRIVVLHRGVVQQVGSPLELYHRPANRFVAAFIGSPSMNFFGGTLEAAEVRRFVGDGVELALGAEEGPRARPSGGRCWMGVRPEAVSIAAEADGDLTGEVVLVEAFGHEWHVVVDAGGTQVIARVPGQGSTAASEWRPGQRVGLRLDRSAFHWFDAEGDEQRLE